jgi:predicted PolB exonuclease-like 3'-5' exonuclease
VVGETGTDQTEEKMKIVTLDIETIAVGTTPEGDFPKLHLHRPVCVVWLMADTSPISHMEFKTYSGEPDQVWEKTMLDRLREECVSASRLVTYNGRCFDMPLLNLRALRHGADWSWYPEKRHRYPAFKRLLYHYDLQDQLGDYGAARNFSLDGVATMADLPGKVGLDSGFDVQRAWETNRKKVITYCQNDVFLTWMLYLKTAKAFGWLKRDAQRLWDFSMEWVKNTDLAEFY